MRYFITLSYDGTSYHGWQIQPNGISVQGELQRCLSMILRTEISVVGAGRTDAGVHAKTMVVHFETTDDIDCQQLAYRLNRVLPPDISTNSIYPVNDNMHARFSAKERSYRYFVHTHRDPFVREHSVELHYALDFDAMNRAATLLLQAHDFRAGRAAAVSIHDIAHGDAGGWSRTYRCGSAC